MRPAHATPTNAARRPLLRERRGLLASVVAALALVTASHAAAYAKRAHACRFMRLPSALRAPCCDLATKDRFTPPGGDCCKRLLWEEAEPAASTPATPPVPPAAVAWNPPMPVALPPLEADVTVAERARAPPPRWRPTDTIVLLI
ncbi:MAG TPA: hypothetical protein RMH85_14405 [Polyangiaceae bacterium LLY-WYZ-15_(1-7)]|nr:hypothetical protein [Sandaracinus sp.]MBJ70490.1 hypothetical protein [Sandaracinus sp.]HJL05392.1 hypothetical protein [Polyangiaceae bacterium LLY-WYZ-15_(1-7)]HJL09691.1 hypothetical protein [Polyangiaceae bacterium LLY-WYZ-15_(1-7)]HJL25918.1 hypothetical protein [Polyangiaceae bacterium LLY-WYZ-15_(1-7)]